MTRALSRVGAVVIVGGMLAALGPRSARSGQATSQSASRSTTTDTAAAAQIDKSYKSYQENPLGDGSSSGAPLITSADLLPVQDGIIDVSRLRIIVHDLEDPQTATTSQAAGGASLSSRPGSLMAAYFFELPVTRTAWYRDSSGDSNSILNRLKAALNAPATDGPVTQLLLVAQEMVTQYNLFLTGCQRPILCPVSDGGSTLFDKFVARFGSYRLVRPPGAPDFVPHRDTMYTRRLMLELDEPCVFALPGGAMDMFERAYLRGVEKDTVVWLTPFVTAGQGFRPVSGLSAIYSNNVYAVDAGLVTTATPVGGIGITLAGELTDNARAVARAAGRACGKARCDGVPESARPRPPTQHEIERIAHAFCDLTCYRRSAVDQIRKSSFAPTVGVNIGTLYLGVPASIASAGAIVSWLRPIGRACGAGVAFTAGGSFVYYGQPPTGGQPHGYYADTWQPLASVMFMDQVPYDAPAQGVLHWGTQFGLEYYGYNELDHSWMILGVLRKRVGSYQDVALKAGSRVEASRSNAYVELAYSIGFPSREDLYRRGHHHAR